MPTTDFRYGLVVFDWDGTLIDSAAAIVVCIQQAARDIGVLPPEEARARHVIGLGLHDSLRHAVPDLPVDRYMEFAARYRDHFLEREPALPLFPGVRELLSGLKAAGRQLAIATGKSRRGLDRGLAMTGLAPYFSYSRCADETHPKPHPAMLQEIMSRLDMPCARTLMVGDTSHDMELARAAAVEAVAVTYGAHAEALLRAHGPKACVGSVAELDLWLSHHG